MSEVELDQFETSLKSMYQSAPRVALALIRSHEIAKASISYWSSNDRMKGLDELLHALDIVAREAHQIPELSQIDFLFHQVRQEFDIAIDATFSGENSVLFDSMRRVMEIEYLFIDFSSDPKNIADWIQADQKRLRSYYGPNQLRQRMASRAACSVDDLPTASDYKGHSMFLHVGPTRTPLGGPGILWNRSDRMKNACVWEMYRHGGDVLVAIAQLLAIASSLPDNLAEFFGSAPQEKLATFFTMREGIYEEERAWASDVRAMFSRSERG